jgi:hypothetical protein
MTGTDGDFKVFLRERGVGGAGKPRFEHGKHAVYGAQKDLKIVVDWLV